MSQGFVNPQPITLPVPVSDGGTGNSSATAYAVQCGGTTSTGAHQSIASVGTSGQVLTSNGAGALPTFQANAASAGAADVWVNFNGTGTVAIRASLNVTSITDNGVGQYTVNFTNAFANTDYATVIGWNTSADGSYLVNPTIYNKSKATGSIGLYGQSGNNGAYTYINVDFSDVNVVCFNT